MQISKQLGKYQIQEHLGSGGFGDVFKALDAELHRTVALKILKTNLVANHESVNRFIQEARTLARLDHPKIAWVWDLGEAEGQYFIAMRYIEGVSLEALLKERKQLPWEEVVHIIKDVSEALAFAHQQGFVHRDVKPANILISKKDGAVLSDFGLVKVMDSSGMTTGSAKAMGTLAYMAPEVLNGKPATPAADVFSLACVLVEMLTGNGPFHAPTPQAIVTKHFMPLQLPETWPEGTPANINEIIHQVFEQEPENRASISIFMNLPSSSSKTKVGTSNEMQSFIDKAESYLEKGEYEKAILYFSMAIELDPNAADYFNNRGMSYYFIKQYDLAIKDYSHAIELHPGQDVYFKNRGNSYYFTSQFHLAIKDYSRAIELNPDVSFYFNKRGMSYHAAKQYDLAIKDYSCAIELEPNSETYFHNRGYSYHFTKQYDLAIKDYSRAIEFNPNEDVYFNHRGDSYRNTNQNNLAIKDYSRAIELNPDKADYFINRGNSYYITKQYDLAIKDYSRAIELNPNNADYFNYRGCIYFATNQYDLAIKDFSHAIQLNPNDSRYLYNRGNLLFRTNRYEPAIEDFSQAIQLKPNNPDLYHIRYQAYKAINDPRAKFDFEKAKELGYQSKA